MKIIWKMFLGGVKGIVIGLFLTIMAISLFLASNQQPEFLVTSFWQVFIFLMIAFFTLVATVHYSYTPLRSRLALKKKAAQSFMEAMEREQADQSRRRNQQKILQVIDDSSRAMKRALSRHLRQASRQLNLARNAFDQFEPVLFWNETRRTLTELVFFYEDMKVISQWSQEFHERIKSQVSNPPKFVSLENEIREGHEITKKLVKLTRQARERLDFVEEYRRQAMSKIAARRFKNLNEAVKQIEELEVAETERFKKSYQA